ncbi:ferrous iron transport protein B [Enterococcus lemanii]|uniref:Ferrous iron transport protein B n=1 Tax=Enterococcus lemanii TaxID=1159752 RepID=A0ABV9MX86_9ENTE|nr:ferrous iron transport protein B [Enterococcus lemanii]MBM7708105.1 ferrous iron transport protein B [Enterococcus lemanii]
MKEYCFALIGNPNSGKTSAYNQLTGSMQQVGNWPGVTVERKSGRVKKNTQLLIQDLPGIYSLSPYTPEEIVTRNYLIKDHPDAILNIVDVTNLERNLYLTTQLMEMGIPLVVGLNMMDILKKTGKKINLEKLSYGLGAPIVAMSALKGQGLDDLVQQGKVVTETFPLQINYPTYDDKLEVALAEIIMVLGNSVLKTQARWFAIKLFERDEAINQELDLSTFQKKEIEEIIQLTEKVFQDQSDAIIINERYQFITRLVALCTVNQGEVSLSISDKIDQIVTHRWLALPIFTFIMWLVYYFSIQTIGTIGTDWVNDQLFGQYVPEFVAGWLETWQVQPWLQSLILDGILAGVGAVLGFLPQIMVLFFCLALLEDCGYMARIAFVMDRLFRKFGLSGKSFIPMLIATGCGVPGVMASRTIENEQDRRLTVMVTTFMPCSAKLPVIALIAGDFFPGRSWVAPSAYFMGMLAIILSGIALKKTKLFSSDPAPFIMELPTYHWPRFENIWRQTFDRGFSFVKKAGTLIFVSSIFIWFTSNYNFTFKQVASEESILANLGRLFAPIFTPLGWGNWQAVVATTTGLIAKENIIGTMGILYGNLNEVSETGKEIWPQLQQSFTSVAAYSFLAFNLLCAPCFAAVGAIHREMASLKWTLLAVGYQCALAYVVSFILYQLGSVLFEGQSATSATLLAVLTTIWLGYRIVKPIKSMKKRYPLTRLEGEN